MKLTARYNRFVGILALILALVMCFSACGGSGKGTASNTDGNASDVSVESTPSNEQASSQVDDTASAESKKEDAALVSSQNKDASSAESKKEDTVSKTDTTTNTGSTVWEKDYLKSMPDSVKSKGLTILLWRDLLKTEQKLLDDFVKKTGCKVTKVITTENEYSTKLISMLSAKEAPDICYLINENFPGLVTKAMQPLDAKTFRLDDDCWNKEYMDAYSINGKYFSVAMSGTWSCEDCLYVTYYQPKVLKDCGVDVMPYELYKQGKWNWDTQYEIASKVKNAGKNYIGISLQSYDLMMLSAGEDFVSYDGKQFKNQLGGLNNNSWITKGWQAVAKLNENSLSSKWNLTEVQQGRVGLFTTIIYGAYNENAWKFTELPGGPNSVEIVPVAGPKGGTAYTPYRPKTWGVPKGADNVEGAAYFLRYWLDATNCDMDATHLNKQTKEVFNLLTKKSVKKQIRLSCGVVDYVSSGTYNQVCVALNTTTSANINTVLNSKKGLVDISINRANKDLTRIR